MLKLFYSPLSPFVRKVRVVIHEAGEAETVELIETGGNMREPETMPVAENPLGKIPTLVRPDGPALYDSRVICRYLDDRFSLGLYPETRIWDVLTLEATADGIMEAAVLMVYEARYRPPELVHAPWLSSQWEKVDRALDAIESRWMAHLAGRLDIGHIALGCALGYLDLRHDDKDWRRGRKALADWYAVFSEREAMGATAPPAT